VAVMAECCSSSSYLAPTMHWEGAGMGMR
jgi:hypothetical protein